MSTDYDENLVAEQYRRAKEQPWRSQIETYSLMKLIGDPSGKKVIDIACGEGYFTRLLRRAGAAEVVGIDISHRMIELARAHEAADPLGIEYRIGDAGAIVPQQDFDLAVSAWLLANVRERTELARICRGLACRLRPGGRFVTLTTNPDVYFFDPAPDYRKYGFAMTLADHVYEGAPILWTLDLGDSELKIENYYLPPSAYAEALRNAGFHDVAIHLPELAPGAQGGDNSDYWADFMNAPMMILIDGVT
ncbi:class I SAM-dependent methyltransferase [Nocardia sp. 004]|uniref:class I SAM-dependent methyltransferase n=1 Tax=Nocardia sp. 004 TaxID=3385978 RepID=UPI0039A3F42B